MEQHNGSRPFNGARYGHNFAGDEQGQPDANGQRHSVPLEGKVALIIAGAQGTEHSLAIDFAERGVDVALVYFGERHELARSIKQGVEERDGRCLLISGDRAEEGEREAFAHRVVDEVLHSLGRLDIFVNLQTGPTHSSYLSAQETQQQRALRGHFFPHFAVMKAALDHIVP